MFQRKSTPQCQKQHRHTVMDAIDESEEATASSEELNQSTQQMQQELTVEDKRNLDAVAYFKQRVKDEEERHNEHHRLLKARLLQAIAQTEGSTADSDCWLNNGKIPKKGEPRKLTKEEKTLIRSQVKKACIASKKKQRLQDEQ